MTFKSICESCQDKGYIHTTGHPSLPEGATYIERCDECFQEGRVTWTDEQAAEYVRRRELKKAIRATHRGTMGDPMRPTTRI